MNPQASQHRLTWDLIPWLVNGSISPLDRAQAEAHLATCADCRDELAFQSRLHAGVSIERDIPADCEGGLATLLARIDAEEGPPARADAQPARRTWLLRSLAAVIVLQALGIAALLRPWHGGDAAYRTLSTPRAAPEKALVRFVPSPTLSLAELQQVLASHDLRIVDVNEAGTILSLAPVDAKAATPQAIDAAIASLRRTPGVLLAEPLGRSGP